MVRKSGQTSDASISLNLVARIDEFELNLVHGSWVGYEKNYYDHKKNWN